MATFKIYGSRLQYNSGNGPIQTYDGTLKGAIKFALTELCIGKHWDTVIVESDWKYPNPKKEYGKVMRIRCDYLGEKKTYRFIWVTDKEIKELTPAGNFKR